MAGGWLVGVWLVDGGVVVDVGGVVVDGGRVVGGGCVVGGGRVVGTVNAGGSVGAGRVVGGAVLAGGSVTGGSVAGGSVGATVDSAVELVDTGVVSTVVTPRSTRRDWERTARSPSRRNVTVRRTQYLPLPSKRRLAEVSVGPSMPSIRSVLAQRPKAQRDDGTHPSVYR